MVNLAFGLIKRGIEVDIVLAKAEGAYLREIPKEAQLIDLNAPRVISSLPALVKYLRHRRPAAMLSAMNHANIVAIWAKQLVSFPIHLAVSEHNTLSISNNNSRNIRSKLIPFLMKVFYPKADTVVAVSTGVKEDLIQRTSIDSKKVFVIYNPVVTPDLFSKAAEPLDDSWFAPSSPPVIIGIGRLTAQKNFTSLIRAFAAVRKNRPARLMILGDGEEKSKLEALALELGLQNDVALPGFINNPYKFLKRSALFVLSSKWEGLPTVLIEALALGTPVVSTDCPSGPAEILENGLWGHLVPVEDIDSLANAMLKSLDEPTATDTAKRADNFGMDQAIDGYLSALGLHR